MLKPNKKGQALVEFILIIPIFLIILFLVIDFGRIFYSKIQLENIMGNIVEMYEDGKSNDELSKYVKLENKSASIVISNETEEYIKITLTDSIKLSSPIINTFMPNPYDISVDRIIYYE